MRNSHISVIIIIPYRIYPTVTLTVIVQDAVFAAALDSRRVRAAVAGCGRAAGPHSSVWDLTRGPEAVRLNARRVRAAVAGGGVPGQAFVVRHAPGAAAAGSAALVQVVHVQLQSVADVRLPVLLLLCRAAQQRQMFDWVRPPLHIRMSEQKPEEVPSFSSRRRTCLRTGCRFM